MSRDIRSFFAPHSTSTSKKKDVGHVNSKEKKRVFIIDSDDDEDTFVSMKKKTKSSDKVSPKKSPAKVNLTNFFGSSPVHKKKESMVNANTESIKTDKKDRASLPKKSSSRKKSKHDNDITSLEQHFDDDFDATLSMLDEEMLGITQVKCTKKGSPESSHELPLFGEKSQKTANGYIEKACSPASSKEGKTSTSKEKAKCSKNESKVSSPDTKTPREAPKTPEPSTNDSNSTNSDHKRKANSEAYQRFLQRSGPRNPGSKSIPQGSSDCLKGKTFVISGVLESMEREEAAEMIKRFGGKPTSSVSKKTSYIVLGEEPGASKVAKAEQFGIPQLSEDGLLDLINDLSGKKKSSVPVAEESAYFEKGKRKESETILKSPKKPKLDVGRHEIQIDARKELKVQRESPPTSGLGSSLSSESSDPDTSLRKQPTFIAEPIGGGALWVDKYKPKSTKSIIGQAGDKSNVKKLIKWLSDWHKQHSKSDKKKSARPAPWVKNDDGSYFKAALLSGPPGVGKTTTAHLVCQELGYDVVEFNASDTRSKRLLNEQVAELLASKSIRNFYSDTKKHALVMDEVDGMAGNEDRGGIQELIQLIKNSHVPIICMCNDRSLPKMRSLVNYCFDLRFQRPRLEQIKGAMMSICFKEGIKISGDALGDIITSANQDVRQVLHNLSMWVVKDRSLSAEQAKIDSSKAKKSLKIGPWDVARQVFSSSEQEKSSYREKEELFFQDYNLGPLFVQDTYINVKPHKARGDKLKTLECLSRASDSLAYGDVIERAIRSQNAWSLLPVQAIFSSIIPGHEMAGHVMGQINFPAWLGKNSKRNRMDRLLQELHVHTRLCTSGSKLSMNLDYSYMLRDAIIRPLATRGTEGVPDSIAILQKYQLAREDVDSLTELCLWPNRKDPFASIDSKIKAAFTRAYNKESPALSYATSMPVKKAKAGDAAVDEGFEEFNEGGEGGTNDVAEEEESDDIATDAMIKKGKAKKPAAKKSDQEDTSSSKGKKNSSKARKK